MENVNQSGVTHVTTKGPVTVDSVSLSRFQKKGKTDGLTAQLRQKVTTISSYPSVKRENSVQKNIFSSAEFGDKAQAFTSEENRMAFIDVPVGSTKESVIAKLAGIPNATIYKVLSNAPILDEDQTFSIKTGQKTLSDYANSQALRFPDNEKTQKDGTANKLILDKNNNAQYRVTYFWDGAKEDMDLRGQSEIYVSPELKAELKGAAAIAGQIIA